MLRIITKVKTLLFFSLIFLITLFLPGKISAAVNITYNTNESYGRVNQSFGIIIPQNLNDDQVIEIISAFQGKNIYLKIIDPDVSFLNSTAFQNLDIRDFNWYFYFSQNTNVSSFFNTYITKSTKPAVVELGTFDTGFITSLKNTFTDKIKIHTQGFMFWPREQIKEVLQQVAPPTLEAISFKIVTTQINDNVFTGDPYPIKLMFDTMYDASKDIAGSSGININYPANTVLSLSEILAPVALPKSTTYHSGLLSSAIVSSVQSQNRNGEAPIRYVIAGEYFLFAAQEKIIMTHYADFIKRSPDLIFPMAITENGDPWDNDFFPESDTVPIIGVIGKETNGNLFIILSNTANSDATAKFPTSLNMANYTIISSLGRTGIVPDSQNQLVFSPQETIIIGTNLDNPTDPPTPTPTPTPTHTITPTPQPTIPPTLCTEANNASINFLFQLDSLSSVGNFNTAGGLSITAVNQTNNCYLSFTNQTITLNQAADYSLVNAINIPAGNYFFLLNGPRNISQIFQGITLTSDQSLNCTQNTDSICGDFADAAKRSEKMLFSGDVNLDKVIDAVDFELYRQKVGQTSSGNNADLDYNGLVEYKNGTNDDFAVLKRNFGKRGV